MYQIQFNYEHLVAMLHTLQTVPEQFRNADQKYLLALFTAELARIHFRARDCLDCA